MDKLENFFQRLDEGKINRDKLIWILAFVIVLGICIGVYFLK